MCLLFIKGGYLNASCRGRCECSLTLVIRVSVGVMRPFDLLTENKSFVPMPSQRWTELQTFPIHQCSIHKNCGLVISMCACLHVNKWVHILDCCVNEWVEQEFLWWSYFVVQMTKLLLITVWLHHFINLQHFVFIAAFLCLSHHDQIVAESQVLLQSFKGSKPRSSFSRSSGAGGSIRPAEVKPQTNERIHDEHCEARWSRDTHP